LITGAAGFVGYHLSQRLVREGWSVLGVDNLDPYYDPALKRARLARLAPHDTFRFEGIDLCDAAAFGRLVAEFEPVLVVHLAARAGVRNPGGDLWAYARPNLDGFVSVLDACRRVRPAHLVYASSSSVYGTGSPVPFREDDRSDRPDSFYAATKRSNELMAQAFAGLEGIRCTGLRFFTLYGPWGRPDMAYYSFAQRIVAGEPITLHDPAVMRRDFTYIDDAIEAVFRLLVIRLDPQDDPSSASHRLYNIGNSRPVALLDFVAVLERALGRTALRTEAPMQPGEVPETYADIARLAQATGYAPTTDIETGLGRFVDWFREERAERWRRG